MKIEINCSNCKADLEIKDKCINTLGDLTIEVSPCNNIDCYDCKDCETDEENKKLQQEVMKLKEQLKETSLKANELTKQLEIESE
jgi:hypothetical protein